jgi:cobalt-zinc-cadmium efflux system outer membrane protein
MLKNILLSGLFCASLYAESFDTFLQRAIENSPYLKSSALGIEQAKEEGSSLTRYKNPSLELEYSRFEPDVGDSDSGYRVNYAQPIRLWGVGNDKERLSEATVQNAKADYAQKKAEFIRDISLFYTRYAQQKMLVDLGNEELRIAEKIYEISKARYEAGTISRGVMLQSQVAYEMIQIRTENLSLTAIQNYYDLLKRAGVNQEIELDTEHEFVSKVIADNTQNPDILSIQRKQDKAVSQAAVNSNKVEWMSLYAEYESEPEQDITRFGVNLPLAFFNTKSQEMQIARLEADKADLLIQNKNVQLDIENSRLQKQKQTLTRLKDQNRKVLKTEIELLKMFEEGYKIANINLLELQDIKNKVIETKERLIQIKTALNQNAIITNYMQGNYNE